MSLWLALYSENHNYITHFYVPFRNVMQHESKYVTVYGKTRHIGFSMKIVFDASLISSTLELPHLQV